MRKTRLAVLVAVLTATVLAWGGSAGAYPIVNGSFEDGPAVGSFVTLYSGDTSINGWVVAAGSISIDYIGSYWTASDGVRSIDLAGDTDGAIAQTLSTVPGTTYRVNFDLAGNPDNSNKIKHLQVSAGGNVQDYWFDATGYTRSNMGWTEQVFFFTALDYSTTLQFASIGNNAWGPALDNVRLSPVPLPAAVWLLGSGLIGLVGLRRRFGR